MIEYRVDITTKARLGLLEIADYIISRGNPENAKTFTQKLATSFQKTLSIFPYGGTVYKKGERTIYKFPHGNYNAYYEVFKDEQVVSILYIVRCSLKIENIIDPDL
jgi:plasmid stabilization system protein ParE